MVVQALDTLMREDRGLGIDIGVFQSVEAG